MLKLPEQLFFIRRLVVLTALQTDKEAWNLQIYLFSSISLAKIYAYKFSFSWITKRIKLKISCENNQKNIQKKSAGGFLTKWQNGIIQIYSKFTRKHPHLLLKFMKTTHMCECSAVNSCIFVENLWGTVSDYWEVSEYHWNLWLMTTALLQKVTFRIKQTLVLHGNKSFLKTIGEAKDHIWDGTIRDKS